MKRITKLFTLALALPLLSGCGDPNFKEPKFKELGSEVSFDDFFAAYQLKMVETIFVKEDLIGSMELQSKEKSWIMDQHINHSRSDANSESKTTGQYDAGNKVIKANTKYNTKTVVGEDVYFPRTIETTTKINSKAEAYYQNYTDNGKNYIIEINNTAKSFEKDTELSETLTLEKAMDMRAKMLLGNTLTKHVSEMLAAYQTASAERKEDYSFFVNESVFTVKRFNNEIEDILNTASEIIGTKTFDVKEQAQVDFGGDYTATYYLDSFINNSYSKDTSDHKYLANEFHWEKEKGSEEVSVKESKASLKPVDVSNYIKYGTEW